MHWVCLLLPQLAIDGVLRRQSDPQAPLALIGGPSQRRLLHAINPAARALGLRPGMPLAAAQALGGGFAMVEHDPGDAERWRQFLAAWAYRFSSLVSTDLPHSIVLEVGHSLQLFGPWPRLEAQMREELGALGFRHHLVAAPNPHAARVLANVHNGLAVGENTLLNALGQLPVERAGLSPDVARSLSRMGLRKLRQVFALPRDAINRRFPRDVLQHLDRLRGEEAPLAWYQPPDVFEGRIEFEHEVESSQALLFPLRRLTTDLAAFLAGRDGGVQRFTVVLEHDRITDNGSAHSEIEVGLLAAEREPAMLFELTRNRLERVSIPKPVVAMRLLARELPPFVPASRDLFDTRAQQTLPWTQLRERLRARLGDEAVYRVAPAGDPRPERAWRRDDGRLAVASVLPPRPAWLLARPVPLRGHGLRIVSGPERLESGWWDGEDARRDYYVLETAQGQRAWAFAPPGEQGGWMLHGWFA